MSRPALTRRVAAVALLAALLPACATVPTSGPINAGPVLDSGESSQFIRVIAAPPSPGASPVEIVRGFLEANASQQDDWDIARRYLTPAAASRWNPEVSTKVYDFTSMTLSKGPGAVAVQLDQVASLDRAGTLHILRSPQERTLTFKVVSEAGGQAGPQWRISDPRDGTAISLSDLTRGYRPYETFFVSRRAPKLVPDGRLLPVVGPSLPTALTELVLAGPSRWLAPAVRSGAPEGLSLALGAVPVDSGVAVVDLARSALAIDPVARTELAAQLTWTLTQLPQVSAIRMTVESEPYDIPGAPALLERASWRALGPDTTVGASGQPPYFTVLAGPGGTILTRVTRSERSSSTLAVPGGGSRVGELAVALDESAIAAVAATGKRLWLATTGQEDVAREVTGQSISGASFDVDGAAWFTDRNRLWRVAGDGPPQQVRITDQPQGALTGVSLARDGARAALVIGGEVFIAAVSAPQARQAGNPAALHLDPPRPGAFAATRIRSLGWRDASGLELLGAADAGAVQVLHLTLADGNALPGGAPERPRLVTSAPGAPTLVVGSGAELFTGVGMQWRGTGAADAAAYPG